jgi:hypothetical protein
MSGISRAACMYFGVMTARGNSELRWSGSQNESIPVATAVR